jgi:hypothetical protein
MNGRSRQKSPPSLRERHWEAALQRSRQANRHRLRHGERSYPSKGAAYQAGYLVGYAAAFQWWHRQVYGYQRGRQ